MITTNLTGNFGNNVHYYTICRVVGEKLGYDWGINPSPIYDYHNGQSQLYFMDIDYGQPVKIVGKNERGLNVYEGITNEYYDNHKPYNHNGHNCLINMYDPNVFDIKDNTMIHLISQSEDYYIDRKNDILNWFKIKDNYKTEYEDKMIQLGIVLDDNTCIINFRGGEYNSIPNLICGWEYWKNSINHMLSINPDMKFVIITDDPNCARSYIGNYPCYHIDIGFDFYVINQSKYLILSNSSFGGAAWLNQQAKFIIAPKYWSQYQVSNGFWGLGDQYTRGFMYMDREGNLSNYEQCKEESLNYYKNNNLL